MSNWPIIHKRANLVPRSAVLAALALALATQVGCARADLVAASGIFRLADAHNQIRAGAGPAGGVFVGKSISGKFLAGRHAEIQRDVPRAADYMSEVLGAAPDHQGILRRTFLLTLSDGRIGEALGLARRLADKGGDAPIANLLLALQHLKEGDMAAAEAQLEGLTGSGPNALLVPMVRAWALAGAGRGAQAIELLSATNELGPLGLLRDLHLGMLAEFAGLTEEAEKFYRAAANDPDNMGLRTVRTFAAFLSRSDKSKQARALFDLYMTQNPDSILLEPWRARLEAGEILPPVVNSPRQGAAEALYVVANALQQQRAGASALLYVRMVLDLEPEDPLYTLLLARVLESQNRYEAAVEVLEEIDPASAFGWLARLSISANLHALERVDDAAELLQVMTEERPERTDAVISLGDLLRQEERYDEAVEAYDLAISRMEQSDQRDWRLLYGRGIALERSKDWDRAEADFLQALELVPDQPLVLNYLGYSWVDMGMHLDRAQEMIQRAVALRPRDGYIVDSLGWVLYRLGDYEGAVRNLERAVELRPNDPIINDHLGDAFWLAGRRNEARFQWRRALGFDPEPDIRSKIEAKLDGREEPDPTPVTEQAR